MSFKVILGIGLTLFALALQIYVFDPPFTTYETAKDPVKVTRGIPRRIFTVEELAKHTGENPKYPPYIAVLGDVFDVSSKMGTYGPGGSYSFFTGKDASRAFVTGKFTKEGLIDNIDGLSSSDIAAIQEWNSFYKKDYDWIGKVSGTYYDENGKETQNKKNVKKHLNANQAEEAKKEELRKSMPTCNMKYVQNEGRTIWCEPGSGGIQRNWAGYPRQRKIPGKGNYGEQTECVCVQEELFNDPSLKEYEGCGSKSRYCHYDKDGKPVQRKS